MFFYRLMENIHQSQPPGVEGLRKPDEINLNKRIASLSDIQTAFVRMHAVCVPGEYADIGQQLRLFV